MNPRNAIKRSLFDCEGVYYRIKGEAMIRFNFDESKALEALVYVAGGWPGITPFYLSKVLFFADRDHLRKYGRPVTGDSYIAMANGPVPSRIYDIVKGNLDFFGAPEAIEAALRVDRNAKYHRLYSQRSANTDLLSETDVAALDDAMAFCRTKSFGELSNITHQEPAWASADPNAEMDPELLVGEDMREEVRETAAYALL
jgi:uncharacterized phage-associated protein